MRLREAVGESGRMRAALAPWRQPIKYRHKITGAIITGLPPHPRFFRGPRQIGGGDRESAGSVRVFSLRPARSSLPTPPQAVGHLHIYLAGGEDSRRLAQLLPSPRNPANSVTSLVRPRSLGQAGTLRRVRDGGALARESGAGLGVQPAPWQGAGRGAGWRGPLRSPRITLCRLSVSSHLPEDREVLSDFFMTCWNLVTALIVSLEMSYYMTSR